MAPGWIPHRRIKQFVRFQEKEEGKQEVLEVLNLFVAPISTRPLMIRLT
jgi:hypothetical protein